MDCTIYIHGGHLREWKLNEVDPCEMDVWRSNVRSVMHAASQLPEGGSPLMWMMFLHLHINANANDDDIVKKVSAAGLPHS